MEQKTLAYQASCFAKNGVFVQKHHLCEENTFVIMEKFGWQYNNGRKIKFNVYDYNTEERHSLPANINARSVWIHWNLPIGVVVTLVDTEIVPYDYKSTGDISHCGGSVDLVGNGESQLTELKYFDMCNCISTWFWRNVDLSMGAIELFRDSNFSNNYVTIFLSEWSAGEVHSIKDWWIYGRITSARWKSMNGRQVATLYANTTGRGGRKFTFNGWSKTSEISFFEDYNFNDMTGAFSWHSRNPIQEDIEPFEIAATSITNADTMSSYVSGTNYSSVTQPVTLAFNKEDVQEVTVETHEQHVGGASLTVGGEFGIPGKSMKVEATVSYQYTKGSSNKAVATSKVGLNFSQTVNAPPYNTYTARLQVLVGKLPAKVYRTYANRWYDVRLPGSTWDSSCQLYKRREPISLTVRGTLASRTHASINATKIEGSPKADKDDTKEHKNKSKSGDKKGANKKKKRKNQQGDQGGSGGSGGRSSDGNVGGGGNGRGGGGRRRR